MRNRFIYILLFGLIVVSVGCKKNSDLFVYDTQLSSIYFGFRFPVNSGDLDSQKGIDSLAFSFIDIDVNEDRYVVKVPVHISGISSDVDRQYDFKIVDSLTTLESEYYRILRSSIGQGKYVDSLEIEVYKHEELRDHAKRLAIQLLPNENFDIGYYNNQLIKINISNILIMPDWWPTWESVFGSYSQEKYQVWSNIYHERADGYLDYSFNYKNMPAVPNPYAYPSTFSFISQLKQYFEENIVYEGGNPDNPRVRIPYKS